MTVLEQMPLTLFVPLWEDPPGVLRVGKSRVLLELLIHAFQRGETPEGIVQSYTTLSLPDSWVSGFPGGNNPYGVPGKRLGEPRDLHDRDRADACHPCRCASTLSRLPICDAG